MQKSTMALERSRSQQKARHRRCGTAQSPCCPKRTSVPDQPSSHGAVRAVDLPTLAADEDDGAPPLFTEAHVHALAAAAVALAVISFKFLVWDVSA